MFDYEVLSQTPLGMLQYVWYIHHITFLKSKKFWILEHIWIYAGTLQQGMGKMQNTYQDSQCPSLCFHKDKGSSSAPKLAHCNMTLKIT